MKEVRVRFAPSPTGFLHVGGARTAIFNWLFARNQNGRFLIRIEDTDPERSKSELSAQILRSMEWLKMRADEPIVYQSDNINRYKSIAADLVKNGKAYYDFETYEEQAAKRKDSEAKKIQYKYDRSSLKLDSETIEKYLAEGKNYAVRFLVPEGKTEFNDIVHGKTEFQNSEIDDFVILRSDGSPVYQLAVVVDDHDMKISHVIRGDDHLSNTPKQILLYKAMGWEVPVFAHLPMILDEQKKKLSKRRNTVSIEEYKSLGYLPEALFNFLTLLGFAPENNREIIPKAELINEFTFDRVNKRSAVFDMNKLAWINADYIRSGDENEMAGLIAGKLVEQGIISADNKTGVTDLGYHKTVYRIMKERSSTINDFVKKGIFFFQEPAEYDTIGIEKHWNRSIRLIFVEYSKILENSKDFNISSIESDLRDFAEKHKIKASALIHPLRLALTGMTTSPGIFEVMHILGKASTVLRINRFLEKA